MNLLPNPLLTNVLDMAKLDQQQPAINSGSNLPNFPNKNGIDTCSAETSHANTMTNNISSIENFLSNRNLTNQLVNNTGLPLGAQIFTIPASLATFPNSDLIPVFINSLGQMVLANTGNILANSLASLATTLTSIQQLSVNRDPNLITNNQNNIPNPGIMEHMMQQYQQLQLLKNSMIQQPWPGEFQPPSTNQNSFSNANAPIANANVLKPSDKINGKTPFQVPVNCNSGPGPLQNDKFLTANISLADRAVDNKSPSANSSVSSRSIGNKICQMIDVSHDYILSQDDHLVKEKAVELLRNSHNHKNPNKSAPISEKSDQNPHNMTVDGVDIGEIKEFARNFKIRRLSMGLTQTQVGQALTAAEGPAYSQSAICRFEKLDITPKSAQKIKPILEKWIKESEEKYLSGSNSVDDGSGSDINKKRKRRTSFTPQALEILNIHFERKSHPTGSEMRALANDLNYDREVIRVWFCNKRQALKNSAKRIKQTIPNGEPNNQHILPQIPNNNLNCEPLLSRDFRILKSESQLMSSNNNYTNHNTRTELDKGSFNSADKLVAEDIKFSETPLMQNQIVQMCESQLAGPN